MPQPVSASEEAIAADASISKPPQETLFRDIISEVMAAPASGGMQNFYCPERGCGEYFQVKGIAERESGRILTPSMDVDSPRNRRNPVNEAHLTKPGASGALIPDWAAVLFAAGSLLAIGGFLSAWFTDSGIATLIMTIGLAACAAGMDAGERAIADADLR
jgi:hypothetical protein